MKKIVLAIIFLFSAFSPAFAQTTSIAAPDMLRYPSTIESHNYTVVVKEDGKSQVWFRVDGFQVPKNGGEYRYTLPSNVDGDVLGWYRENGCLVMKGDFCSQFSDGSWQELKISRDKDDVVATIPARKTLGTDPHTLGFFFKTKDVTAKKWWGRNVNIETGKSLEVVQYLSVGVYVPDGVYVRDIQEGPTDWGTSITSMMVRSGDMSMEKANFQAVSPTIFDSIGGGEIIRSRNNLMPGENYTFSFMSSPSKWKLYSKELSWGVAWILAIAVVLSILLYMIIGKKTIGWYLTVVFLLMTLMILIMGLMLTYRLNFPGGRTILPDPLLMEQSVDSMGATGVAEPALREAP